MPPIHADSRARFIQEFAVIFALLQIGTEERKKSSKNDDLLLSNKTMATREEYKLGIDVVNPAPSGTGGDLIQDNFKTIADLIDEQNTALSGKAPTSHTHSYNDLTNKPTIPPAYSLPTASTSTLGGVKVDGTTIKINNGVISAPGSGGGGSDGTQLYGSPKALITRANVGPSSDIVNNDNRGYLSVDFQAERAESSNYAKGDYSFLHGRNSGISAQDGYAFGSGTDFDVVGAIQTNQNKAGSYGWQGHTGILGLSFAPRGNLNAEIFALDTGAIALFDVDIIVVSNGRLTLYKLALSVYQGTLAISYNQFTPICQWTPNFYLSDNKLYLTGGNADVVQVGIRYTILGAATDNGTSSSGGVA